ncbi:MAG: AraC family transcriptional regulator [Lachnospiraceae bacterium]|nr:AraC family transcriptional regulator [Lachnospiraceae bacterium]
MNEEAIKYIKENYSRQITAEKLAEVVNLSPVYFSHLFKKQIGMNMTDYITDYRMKIAKKKLLETDDTIYEIALSVGFQEQRYFSKRFKQIVGMTPTEFRKLK